MAGENVFYPVVAADPNKQLAQFLTTRPTTAIIPAEQVVMPDQTAQEKAMSDYFESLFSQGAGTTVQAAQPQVVQVQQPQQQPVQQPVQSIGHYFVKDAPVQVAPNETTNFWKQNQAPVFTYNSVSGIPEYSLGGQLLLARQLGMTPQQMLSGLDAIQAHGITESPYWQDQYNTALAQTGDPNAAMAHANLAATEAADNVAGIFARSLAAPTDTASQIAADRAYARTVLNPAAGEVNKNVLATVNIPVGATPQGNVLTRSPDGKVTMLPIGPTSAANASALNSGAQYFGNALARQVAANPVTAALRKGTDPYMQELRRQQLELRVEAARKRLEADANKDPQVAEAMRMLRVLPKDDPRRDDYLELLDQKSVAAGIVPPKEAVPPAR